MVALIALVLLVVAAATGTVLLRPELLSWGVPPALLPATPFVLLAAMLSPALVLSGDWLWMNGRRRRGPGRGVIVGRVSLLTATASLAVPLFLTTRPLGDVVRDTIALAGRSSPGALASTAVPPPPRPVSPPPSLAIAPPPSQEVPAGTPARRWGPAPAPAEPPSSVVPPPPGEAPPLPVVAEAPADVLPAGPPPDGTFFVYEWLDPAGDAHYSDELSDIPREGKVLRAIVMKPSPGGPAPLPVQPPLPARPAAYDPTYGGLMPAPAEQYWRSRFQPAYRRISDQERRIAAKQEEIDTMPALANREAAFAQLRQLREGLKQLEQELQELERDASNRAVPREWRR